MRRIARVASTLLGPVPHLVPTVVLAIGCGRRATEADCRLIVDKAVELQMKELSRTDAPAIQKREEEVRAELQGEIQSCQGRHVTDRTMTCIQAATTTRELDACLR
jgi:hypothetical protein